MLKGQLGWGSYTISTGKWGGMNHPWAMTGREPAQDGYYLNAKSYSSLLWPMVQGAISKIEWQENIKKW